MPQMIYDTAIVGGGPAGLAAALALSRARRTAVIFNNEQYRNEAAEHMHTVPTWDHHPPSTYRAAAIAELQRRYTTNTFIHGTITAVTPSHPADTTHPSFTCTTAAGNTYTSRTVILATGSRDLHPPIPGFAACWGKSIFHCLFCHGYDESPTASAGVLVDEPADTPSPPERLAHYVMFAFQAARFARAVTIFTNGGTALQDHLPAGQLAALARAGIGFEPRPIATLTPGPRAADPTDRGPGITAAYADGAAEWLGFLGALPRTSSACEVTQGLEAYGLRMTPGGDVATGGPFGDTGVPGLFVAGDAGTMVKSVTAAVMAGVSAGAGAHHHLLQGGMGMGEEQGGRWEEEARGDEMPEALGEQEHEDGDTAIDQGEPGDAVHEEPDGAVGEEEAQRERRLSRRKGQADLHSSG